MNGCAQCLPFTTTYRSRDQACPQFLRVSQTDLVISRAFGMAWVGWEVVSSE